MGAVGREWLCHCLVVFRRGTRYDDVPGMLAAIDKRNFLTMIPCPAPSGPGRASPARCPSARAGFAGSCMGALDTVPHRANCPGPPPNCTRFAITKGVPWLLTEECVVLLECARPCLGFAVALHSRGAKLSSSLAQG